MGKKIARGWWWETGDVEIFEEETSPYYISICFFTDTWLSPTLSSVPLCATQHIYFSFWKTLIHNTFYLFLIAHEILVPYMFGWKAVEYT